MSLGLQDFFQTHVMSQIGGRWEAKGRLSHRLGLKEQRYAFSMWRRQTQFIKLGAWHTQHTHV